MINVNKQNGFALISALVVLAIVTGATVAMVVKQTNGIELATNIIRYNQINNYSDGILLWAEGVLFDDIKENNTDSAQDIWNLPLVDVEIEGGQIDARIIDLQSKFNINNLILSGEEGELARSRFRRLLNLVGIQVDITDALTDWIDADSEVRFPNGAEDAYYLSLDKPYRAANNPMLSNTELLQIKGVTIEIYQKLIPFISTLDVGVGININSADETVLMAMSENMDLSAVESIKQLRETSPITKIETPPSESEKETQSNNSSQSEQDELYEDCKSHKFEQMRDKCFRDALENQSGKSVFNNSPTQENILGGNQTASYNLNSKGISTNSSYFLVTGYIEQFGNNRTVAYVLVRDVASGKIDIISKKYHEFAFEQFELNK